MHFPLRPPPACAGKNVHLWLDVGLNNDDNGGDLEQYFPENGQNWGQMVGKRYKYDLTYFVRQAYAMALKLREMMVIPQLVMDFLQAT